MGLVARLKKVGAKRLDLHVMTSAELNRIQEYLLQMLKDICLLCKENNIVWSLCGGSLIGAVRHKGFIPWDDDVDILMTRSNFIKFQEAISYSETISKKYDLKVPGNLGYIHSIARLCTKEKVYVPILSTGIPEGIPIDIFILENTYDNVILRLLHGIQCKMLMCIGASARAYACKELLLKYGENDKKLLIEIKFWLFLYKFFSFHTVEEWWRIADECFSKVDNESSKFVVSPRGSRQYFGEIYEREKISEFINIEFEDTKLPILRDADYLLTKLYGRDYLIPPALDKIEQHVFVELNFNFLNNIHK